MSITAGGGGPLVSVILPTRDRAPLVGRAVESVLAQSHRPLEVLVVDDASRDDTRRVLEQFGSEITVLSGAGAGAYAARNLALRHASGELVAFIDSDDAWHPRRLARQLPLLERPRVGLVFGDAAHVHGSGRRRHPQGRTSFQVTPPRRGRVAEHFAWGNFVPTVTVLVRRRCLEEVGGFPTSHDVSGDYLTWFRIALRHELDYVGEALADYSVHAGGISRDLGRSLRARIELFSAELECTPDPAARAVLQRLVFNLGLHLALASARRRAGSVDRAWDVAGRALAVVPAWDAVGLGGAFAVHHARLRARRLRLRAA